MVVAAKLYSAITTFFYPLVARYKFYPWPLLAEYRNLSAAKTHLFTPLLAVYNDLISGHNSVPRQGIEHHLTASEAVVLPLHQLGIFCSQFANCEQPVLVVF
jgi:hypothetical protein